MEQNSSSFFDYVREDAILQDEIYWLVYVLEWAATAIDIFEIGRAHV